MLTTPKGTTIRMNLDHSVSIATFISDPTPSYTDYLRSQHRRAKRRALAFGAILFSSFISDPNAICFADDEEWCSCPECSFIKDLTAEEEQMNREADHAAIEPYNVYDDSDLPF